MDPMGERKTEESMASTRKQVYFAQYLKTKFNYKITTLLDGFWYLPMVPSLVSIHYCPSWNPVI